MRVLRYCFKRDGSEAAVRVDMDTGELLGIA